MVSMLAGLHGTDLAAQVYRVTQIHLHGVAFWDPGWYAGNYPLAYSAIYPVLAATFGIGVITVISVGVAAWAFDSLVVGYFGFRPVGSWYFAASTVVEVAIGQLPFLLGESLGLMAVLAVTKRRFVPAGLLALGAWGASPTDAVFVALALVAVLLTRGQVFRPGGRRSVAVVVSMALAPMAATAVAFPGTGSFPFPGVDLLAVLAACAVVMTGAVGTNPTVRTAAVLYAVLSLALWVVANPLGANVDRLATDIGVPLLICFMRAFPLRLAALLAAPAIVWQWAPGTKALAGPDRTVADTRAFYAPLLREMAVVDQGRAVRLEIPPTYNHWESAFVAPYVALARGWERQLDTVDNPIFYRRRPITGASYQRWLTDNGIEWVALANAALDYAAVEEAAMLRSQRSPTDLRLVWHSATWTLWRVTDNAGLVDGPGRVTILEPDRMSLMVTKASLLTVKIRYSRYLTVSRGQACLGPGIGGWTEVRPARPGELTLQVSPLPVSSAHGCR